MALRLSFLVALFGLVAGPVAAQSTTETHLAETLRHRGVQAARSDNWEEARELFSRSYAIDPALLTLYNLATAEERCGALVEADAHFRRFITLTRDGRHEAFHAESLRRREAMSTRIGRVSLRVENLHASDQLRLNGQDVAHVVLGEELLVNPGELHIEVVRGSESIAEERTTMDEGEARTIELSVPVFEPTGLSPDAPEPTVRQEGGEQEDIAEPGMHPAYAYITAGAALVAGGLVIWSGIDTNRRNDDFEAYAAEESATFDEASRRFDRARRAERRTNGLIGTAAGLGAISVLLFILADYEREPNVAVGVDADGAYAALRGEF